MTDTRHFKILLAFAQSKQSSAAWRPIRYVPNLRFPSGDQNLKNDWLARFSFATFSRFPRRAGISIDVTAPVERGPELETSAHRLHARARLHIGGL
jgi:hypothetical protein